MRILLLPVRAIAIFILIISMAMLLSPAVSAASDFKFNMSYIYFGSSSAYMAAVNNTKGALNDVSPSYFDINPDGTLKLTDAINADIIAKMHAAGVRVTPFLSNHWNRENGIKALENRELLSTQITDAVAKYNLDGVNVDIENVTVLERSIYIDFVELLREKLPQGKSLSVAVAPNPDGKTTGWSASYNYAALASHCDYLMLMAYDDHYQGGPAGPVAGAQFVEKSLKSLLEKVPSDKVVLGIPFYGRYWKQGAEYGGYGISASFIDGLVKKYRGTVVYDNAAQTPKATITIIAEDIKPVVLGKSLEAGKYDIWYENEQSIKYKLTLVKKYNLKGTGSWSLGQESEGTWDYYKLWLNGLYFSDTQGHWAIQSILDIVKRNWMVGVSESQFMPETPLTRAQAAVVLVRAMGLSGAGVYTGNETDFTDTAGHWARNEINIARQYEIMKGTGNEKFSPDVPLTREEMAVMLDRILVQLTGSTADKSFSDVTPETSPWAFASIGKMAGNDIMQGYSDGLFHPRAKITRAQMAVLMDRVSGYLHK